MVTSYSVVMVLHDCLGKKTREEKVYLRSSQQLQRTALRRYDEETTMGMPSKK